MKIHLSLALILLAATPVRADVFETARKKCQKLSSDHRWIELTDKKDSSIAGFCEIDKVKDGPTLEPYPGTEVVKKEGAMKKGQMHGEWRRYYASGKLRDEGNWFEGAPDGSWKFWREDGELSERGRFAKGIKICKWEKWDESGQKSVEELPAENGGSCGKFVLDLNQLNVYTMYLFQEPTQYIYTGGIGWEPKLKHTSFPLYFKPALSVFLNRGTPVMFPAIEIVAKLGATLFQKINLEAGWGKQRWISVAESTADVWQTRIGYQLSFWRLSEIWASGSQYTYPDKTYQWRVGVTIKL